MLLVGTLLSACSVQEGSSFLQAQGPVSAAQQALLFKVLGLMLIVVLPVLVLTPLFAWRYRRRRGGAYQPKWEFSWPLELLIWGVPLAVVAVLAWNLWRETVQLDPYRPVTSTHAALDVQVIGLDWKWLFIYPEQNIATVNQLVFPVQRPLRLHLTSDTVMQSFFIPALGSQIYAMAGMETQLNLKADETGRFVGKNTQFNGSGFHRQNFSAHAVSAQAFISWVQSARRKSPLSHEVYKTLATNSVFEAPVLYGDVAPDLYASVLNKYRPRAQAAHRHRASAIAEAHHE